MRSSGKLFLPTLIFKEIYVCFFKNESDDKTVYVDLHQINLYNISVTSIILI